MKTLRILEAHNGLSARVVDMSKFDGIWISSLTDSASKGLPDTELVSYDERLHTIREILNNTDKPVIVDWDTGGQLEHFPYWSKVLDKAGVYAIVIEDKAFPKKNSLMDGVKHNLEDVELFSEKIRQGKRVCKNMKIIARLESLIAKHSVFEALGRAEEFLKAGADGIMIHSKSEVSAGEVLDFAKRFQAEHPDVPLMCVPTTYNHITDKELEDAGFDIICHANHLLRASLKAMKETADKIYHDGCSKGLDIASVKEIFELCDMEYQIRD